MITLVSRRKGRYFTLHEAHTNENIQCFYGPHLKDVVFDSARDDKWVIVSGWLNRSSDPKVMSDITSIDPLDNQPLGAWREAVGCNPPPPTGHDPGYVAIRRLRGTDDD